MPSGSASFVDTVKQGEGDSGLSTPWQVELRAPANFSTSQADVGASAVQIITSPLSGRYTVLVKNLSTSASPVFLGNSSGVLTTTGFELAPGEGVEIDLSAGGDAVWAITASGTQRVCWIQVGA